MVDAETREMWLDAAQFVRDRMTPLDEALWRVSSSPNYFRKRPSRSWSRPTKVLEERNFPNMSRTSRFWKVRA
jgi:hypothetical protein